MRAPRPGDRAFRRLGAQALAARLAELLREAPGVRARTDPEHLHRMRVASRRMRAAARIFAPRWPRAWRPRWRRELRRLTRALGAARDLDVQLAWLDARLATIPDGAPERTALARLRGRLAQARDAGQDAVLRALDRFERDTAPALGAFLATRAAGRAPSPTAAACAAARDALAPLLAALLAIAPRLDDAGATADHHALRIAAKRLRYALEIFAPLDPEPLGTALQATRRLQSKLGHLHDGDVWLALVPAWREEERLLALRGPGGPDPLPALEPGLDLLSREWIARRGEVYAACVALWRAVEADRVWSLLDTAPAPPPPADADA